MLPQQADDQAVADPRLPPAGGVKYDGGKRDLDLLPWAAIRQIVVRRTPARALVHEQLYYVPGAALHSGRLVVVAGGALGRLDGLVEILDACLSFRADKARLVAREGVCVDGVIVEALDEVCQVLEHGAAKYARDNWRGLVAQPYRLRSAVLRHLMAVATGQDADPDTGLPHLAHAACSLMFLIVFELER